MKKVKRNLKEALDFDSDVKQKEVFQQIKKVIRTQLAGKYTLDFNTIPTGDNYKKHCHHLQQLIRKTVTHKESNSLLIVGPRGCGKTALLTSTLEELLEEQEISNNVLVVHLNALLHTDDNIALKDIARQLKLSNVVNDDTVTGSFAENMTLLLEKLKSDENSKAIVFCLEEFDLFCEHRKQNLLYNLFDVAQSQQTPIFVFGITCRLDVIELLEKRVKSRFSHRQIHLFQEIPFEAYKATACYWLTLQSNFHECHLKEKWNNHVLKLFAESKVVEEKLTYLYDFSHDFRALQLFLWPIIASLGSDLHQSNFIEESDFTKSMDMLTADSKALMLKGLTTLELTLVLLMLQHSQIHDGEPFNFHMVYKMYQKLVKQGGSDGISVTGFQEFSKPVVKKSFEHLEHLEFVQGTDRLRNTAVTKGHKDYKSFHLLIDSFQLKETLNKQTSLPTHLQQLAGNIFLNF